MDAGAGYRLRVAGIERTELLLQRHEAELTAKAHLLERAVAISMQPALEDWQNRVEAALKSVPVRNSGITAAEMLKEWEELVVRLEKHAAQLRQKDAEISGRERSVTQREATLQQECQRLVESQEALAEVRAAVEQRTRELTQREADLARRGHFAAAAASAEEWREKTRRAAVAMQEREAHMAVEWERCQQLIEALSEICGRVASLL
ncbi:hypothetical protein DQ04_04781040 [Trypanosoma grayi]|uniref:hypothetical protein n=1 Tax=Trypanosoma grayi TaxID=71804 RepID=UPI0004F4A529|nr:hypothetical protein DQ04_04781040 [Trypanosoma grayi]KEG09712.1 hypothetical protein DQ04_04781040 [Trypanosoma grayi]